ncbi:MAG TPA: hypothetical protein ENL27_02085, partial [Candidatus Parcubacteria bacterium]|nr:hypothetical protein [Candidatus Parcubacteria bacterium]
MELKKPSKAIEKKMKKGKNARAAKFAEIDSEKEAGGEQEVISREEKRKEILKKMEARGGGKWADDVREKEKQKKTEEIGEADELELADKMEREKETSQEELGEEGNLELADKFEKEAKKEVSSEDEKKEKEQEAKKEGAKKGYKYRDEYFE